MSGTALLGAPARHEDTGDVIGPIGRALVFVLLLPRNVCVAVLRAYRAVISPLYGDVCRYYPSCSAYTLGAIQQHGVVVGVGLGAWRLLRCNPWSKGGVDDVPARRENPRAWTRHRITRFGFVLPASHGKG